MRALVYISQKKKNDACADLNKAISLGFSKDYGDEVEQLLKKNCQDAPATNKL